MTGKRLVLLAVALWLVGLSYLARAQDVPPKVDVVAVAGSAWTGVLTIVLPIVFTGALSLLGLWLKHKSDTRAMTQLHETMAADRQAAEDARKTIERRQDEDRADARRIADEDRAEARRVAQRVEQAAIEAARKVESVREALVETTATDTLAATDTRERLAGLTESVQAQNVVAQQTGEVLASVHAFLNSGKTASLRKDAEDARTKADRSRLKEDVDAAELAERSLEAQLEKQLVADTQGGKGQQAGSAAIKAASEALASAPVPKEEKS